MKDKVLVTGGLGFIGSYLAKELSKKYNVIVLDDLSNNKIMELDMIPYDNLYLGSINDYELLKYIVKDIKYIFHIFSYIRCAKIQCSISILSRIKIRLIVALYMLVLCNL